MLSTIIEDLVVAHPTIFRNTRPLVSPTAPAGWRDELKGFCLSLENICTDEELKSFRLHRIHDDFGNLGLDFTFDCEVSKEKEDIIDARAFAARNRSVFCCVICGSIVDTVAKPVLCAKHF